MSKFSAINQPVFIYGASGHAKVVLDILHLNRRPVVAVLDDDESKIGTTIYGYTIMHPSQTLDRLKDQQILSCIVSIGDNRAREAIQQKLMAYGFVPATAIHPSAVISPSVLIGQGSVIMGGAVINADTRLGDGVIVNTGATVDHDCLIDDSSHISPGAHLAGNVTVGKRTHIGIGAAIIQHIRIGNDSTIGAGSVVIRDVPSAVTAVGVPASVIKHKENVGVLR